jgi:hypothetical protein
MVDLKYRGKNYGGRIAQYWLPKEIDFLTNSEIKQLFDELIAVVPPHILSQPARETMLVMKRVNPIDYQSKIDELSGELERYKEISRVKQMKLKLRVQELLNRIEGEII